MPAQRKPRTNYFREIERFTGGVVGPVLGLVPRGVIVLWSGTVASIPTGWHICDGTNGTPNWTDKFIRSASTAGGTGGASTHTHTGPSHTHDHGDYVAVGTTSIDSSIIGVTEVGPPADTYASRYGHTHTFSGDVAGTSSAGGTGDTGSASSLPPYYDAIYIMKL